MIDFTNTEISFRIKRKSDLRRAKLLYTTIGYPAVVKALSCLSMLAVKTHFPIDWLVKPTLYTQFVGGESLEESDKTAMELFKFGVSSILDYSVEGKEDDASIKSSFEEILRGIEFAASRPYVSFAVFKPTGITHASILEKVSSGKTLSQEEQDDFSGFVERVDTLCAKAHEVGLPILIDAEDYCFQKAIDDVVELMMERYNAEKPVVYNTLQMYRKDRLDYLKEMHHRAIAKGYKVGAKFVRGAYMEKERQRALELGYPSPINDTKEDTDQLYDEAIIYTMQHIADFGIFAGTHNEDSVRLLVELTYKYQLQPNDSRIWFSQLYGMSDNLSFNLAAEGFNIAKYLPYGPVAEVLPYLIRRASENTSVAGQTSRELNLINIEVKRRKSVGKW